MSDHPEFEQLSALVDAELGADDRFALERHVESCAECSTTINALRATIADVSTLPPVEMTAEQIAVLDDAVARARAEHATHRRTRFMRLAWAGGGVAASVIALAVFAQSFTSPTPSRDAALTEQAAGGASATNYSEATARDALLAFAGGAAGAGRTTTGGGGAAPMSKDSSSNDAPAESGGFLYSATNGSVAQCDAELRAGNSEGATLARTEGATFKGSPALLYFYLVPAASPTRAELWVVRPADCYTLFFAQTPLKR